MNICCVTAEPLDQRAFRLSLYAHTERVNIEDRQSKICMYCSLNRNLCKLGIGTEQYASGPISICSVIL